jgi:hypothetical protein
MEAEQGNNPNKWIWIGLGAAVLFCCGTVLVAGLVFGKIGQSVQKGMKTDPESASQAAHEIADYTLPSGYQEQMAMDIIFYSFVLIAPESEGSGSPMIILAQFQAGMDQEQMQQQLQQSAEQQFGRNGLEMKLVEVKEMTIRGEDTKVVIYEGTDEDGHILRQLVTAFPGKDGNAMLMIMGAPEYWNGNEINQFIESIH